jgi:hypothetical protein
VEVEFVLGMQRSEAFHELPAEHFFKHIHRQKELLLRVDPPRVARSQTAGGNNTVNMWMSLEFLVPGMEDAEKPDLGAETLGIASSSFDRASSQRSRALAGHFGQCRFSARVV